MAGCERVEVSGTDIGGPKTLNGLNLATLVNNGSLCALSKIVVCIGAMKGKELPTGGEALHKKIAWRDTTLTQAMVPCFNGTSFTNMLFCISQAEENGGETFCSFKFAEECSKCSFKVRKPKEQKLSTLI